MSYGRNPYYIWSNGSKLNFNSVSVSEEEINAFLYKVLLLNRREELARRLKEGKEVWSKQWRFIELKDGSYESKFVGEEDWEVKKYIETLNSFENDILKKLMGE